MTHVNRWVAVGLLWALGAGAARAQASEVPAEVLAEEAARFEAAGRLDQSMVRRRALIERFPANELASVSQFHVGASYEAVGWFQNAAEWFERFARENPAADGESCDEATRSARLCPVGWEALARATRLRVSMRQIEQARADSATFTRTFGAAHPTEAVLLELELGRHYENTSAHAEAARHYASFLRSRATHAPLHVVILAHARRARALRLGGRSADHRAMLAAYTTAIELFDEAPLVADVTATRPESERPQAMREVIDAVGEGAFYLAEEVGNEALAMRFPTPPPNLRGLDGVQRFLQRTFFPVMQQRAEKAREAIAHYRAVTELRATIDGERYVSVNWETAAAYRVGALYNGLLDGLRRVPIPEEIENDGELYEIYAGALEQQAAPLIDATVEAFTFCVQQSISHRWFSNWAVSCMSELADINPRDYPTSRELMPSDGREYTPPVWPAPPDEPESIRNAP